MLTSRYMNAGLNVVSEAFDGDIVVLDLNTGRYFSFTDAGCALWEGLSAGASPQSLLVSGGICSDGDLEAFVQKLIDHHLLVVNPEPGTVAASPETIAKLSVAKEAPEIFVFDDLADLFLADPIHDVEVEAGWPAVNRG